jgi:hypothetical protein
MGSAHPKTPFRQYHVPYHREPGVVGGDISRSFDLSRGLRQTLFIDCPQAVTTGSWIRGFSRVEHLGVRAHVLDLGFNKSATPLFPLHGFSPVIKSLRVYIPGIPPSQIFNLILSFPLLEDLAVIIHCGMSIDNEVDEMPTAAPPPTPSTFTGSLELSLQRGMKVITRRLLSLQSGIHFRRLTLTCFSGEDLLSATALVEGCSHTLESLDINSDLRGTSSRHLSPHR